MQTPKRSVIIFGILAFVAALPGPLFADRISDEGQQQVIEGAKKVMESLQQKPVQQQPGYTDGDIEEGERSYREQPRGRGYTTPGTYEGPMPFEQTAKECGESKQRECAPSNFGGRTMCGRAVAKMIACMGNTVGAQAGCTGVCGNGKDFVNCGSGQMEKCGYEKITDPTDVRCQMAGAVLAYTKSPTTRGSIYGHVEFVCGRGKYCSVYSAPHDRPWPRHPADSCWYPKSGSADGKTKGPQ